MQSLRLKPLSYEQLSGVSGIAEAQARIASILDSSNRLSLAHPIAATYALDLAIENVELYGSVVFNPEAGIRGEKLACTALRVYNKFLDFEPPNTSIVARVARL